MATGTPRYSLELGVILTAMVVGAGGAWAAFERSENMKVVEYESAKELNLSASLKELRELSAALTPALNERKALAELPAALQEIDALKNKLAQAARERDVAQQALAKVVRDSKPMVLKPNKAEHLIGNSLSVALLSTSGTMGCRLRYGDKDVWIQAADKRGGHHGDTNTDFDIHVDHVEPDRCTIRFISWPSKNNPDA